MTRCLSGSRKCRAGIAPLSRNINPLGAVEVLGRMVEAGEVFDVSDDQGAYLARIPVLPVYRFREFVAAPSVLDWLNGPALAAVFIMIHAAEFDSGMSD